MRYYHEIKDEISASVTIRCGADSAYLGTAPNEQVCGLGFKHEVDESTVRYLLLDTALHFNDAVDLCARVVEELQPCLVGMSDLSVEVRVRVGNRRWMAAYLVESKHLKIFSQAGASFTIEYFNHLTGSERP